MIVNFASSTPWALESPVDLVEGHEAVISCIWRGGGTLSISSASVKVYRNSTDVTSTCIPSGSVSISGLSVKLPTIKNLYGNSKYVVVVTMTMGSGEKIVRKIQLNVQKDEGKQ